ncbi:MAG TPA: hypothetical protein VK563_07030 [Puia sp.]|nr:hypothetical protein [Puia sp.]
MFRNNLRIAWRNLVKDRQFTFLNLIGLSTGLACTFLIYLWVSDEFGVDRFNANDSRLYQAMKTFPGGDGSISPHSRRFQDQSRPRAPSDPNKTILNANFSQGWTFPRGRPGR